MSNYGVLSEIDNPEILIAEKVQKIAIVLGEDWRVLLSIPEELRKHKDSFAIAGAIIQRIVSEHGNGKSFDQILEMIPDETRLVLGAMGIWSISIAITTYISRESIAATIAARNKILYN